MATKKEVLKVGPDAKSKGAKSKGANPKGRIGPIPRAKRNFPSGEKLDRVERELKAYIEITAGTPSDLDSELEAAALEVLVKD